MGYFNLLGKETIYITKIFKSTTLKLAYRTNNSIEENLKPKTQTTNKFMACGVQTLTC
jgi:hypothetical protein